MESDRCWCFCKYSGRPTSVPWQIFELIFSLVKKMTFVSKRVAQNSGKSHLCNVKYGSSTMESNRGWCFWKYSGMPTSVSWQNFEFIFSLVNKMTFVSKWMGQISGKSRICNVKYGKLHDGERAGAGVFVSTLVGQQVYPWQIFEFNLFSGQKNDFCIKRDGSKFGKIATFAM